MAEKHQSDFQDKYPRIKTIIENHAPEATERRMALIIEEFRKGFEFLKRQNKTISIFGSARSSFQSAVYKEAELLAGELARQGYAILTGGGPGIMEAANKGAHAAGGHSLGLNIELPQGQRVNPYVKESIAFHHFFVRKVMLAFSSDAYIFFPGGFGTLDEFFELVMLIQTGKTDPVPVILVNKEYWQPLLSWIERALFEQNRAINKEDMDIYRLVDTSEEAVGALKELLALLRPPA